VLRIWGGDHGVGSRVNGSRGSEEEGSCWRPLDDRGGRGGSQDVGIMVKMGVNGGKIWNPHA